MDFECDRVAADVSSLSRPQITRGRLSGSSIIVPSAPLNEDELNIDGDGGSIRTKGTAHKAMIRDRAKPVSVGEETSPR